MALDFFIKPTFQSKLAEHSQGMVELFQKFGRHLNVSSSLLDAIPEVGGRSGVQCFSAWPPWCRWKWPWP